jgi:hypothetical protein
MPRKPRKRASHLYLLTKVSEGGHISDAADDDLRLILWTEGVLVGRRSPKDAQMGVAMTDAQAQDIVLMLLASMRPRTRNALVRAINRGGFGPPVPSARPSRL